MYIPKYKITTQILKDIGTIEVAREIIENAPLVPAYVAKFKDEARYKAIRFGTALEGNDLTDGEAKLIVDQNITSIREAEESGVLARPRDVQEVINYRNVMDFLDEAKNTTDIGIEIMNQIHSLVTERILSKENSGNIRKTQVVLKNSLTHEVAFRPPSHEEVTPLLADFFAWLNSDLGKNEHPVLRAGVTHYVLTAIHPYVEGNGRTARAMAMFVLLNEGYDIKRFFALEEYFDRHSDEYFGALNKVSAQSEDINKRDMTIWLEVFCRALAVELDRIKRKVSEFAADLKIKHKSGKQVSLSERQMKLVEFVHANGQISMAEARGVLRMVSDDTILRDFKYLMEKGVISKRGSTKAAIYMFKK